MNWKKIAGRVLTAVVAVALAVFAIVGQTPPWWAAVIALVVPIANVLIGEWKVPE
jgi:heme A synthase